MKTSKHIIKLFLLFGLITQQSCREEQKLINYKGDKFSVEYPSNWQVTNENEILNFFPKENFGAITISSYAGINFPLEKTKNFIEDLSSQKDTSNKVKMTVNGDITEFYYEYFENDVKWIAKAFRKKNELYLVTINCDFKYWDTNKDLFLRVVNSFKINQNVD